LNDHIITGISGFTDSNLTYHIDKMGLEIKFLYNCFTDGEENHIVCVECICGKNRDIASFMAVLW
jgi:hypothetical protein